jgi:Cysteine-rich CPCC
MSVPGRYYLGNECPRSALPSDAAAAHTANMRVKSAARCLCCGYRTLSVPEALELCQVCWWQDDGQDDRDADVVRRTVNGNLSLSQGRRNYKHYQVADPRFATQVRTPRQEEL